MEKIFTAKTVEEAKELAVKEFGREDLVFEVLEEPKKGFLGIVKGSAKVKASYEPSKVDVAVEYIKGVLDKMGIIAELSVSEIEGGSLINIEGEDVGAIIGRRGDTLDALQYLASMVCNRRDKEYYRICVDSCGYREKRKETLEELALKISRNVLKTGRTAALEPMNPYERRIIHAAVATVEGVSSRSVGEEPYRKVIISSDSKPERRPNNNRGDRNGDRNNNRRGGGRGPRRDSYNGTARSLDLSTSFEKDYKRPAPKPKPEDDMPTELYGKINLD